MMSVREAIEKMGCKEKECKFLDEKGIYTFCNALFTDDMCLRTKGNNNEDERINKDVKRNGC